MPRWSWPPRVLLSRERGKKISVCWQCLPMGPLRCCHVQLDPDNPAILQVTGGTEDAQFLTLTSPLVAIEGGSGSDKITIHYSSEGELPSIYFDGGSGRDTAYVHGSHVRDEIVLVESSNPVGLPPNVLAFNSVKKITVWAGGGSDVVDGSALQDTRTVIFGGGGDDELAGGQAKDLIFGGWGDDTLLGNDGNDGLFGGFGNDTHVGGPGRDFLFDFLGRNTFDDDPWWRRRWF